MNLKELKEMVDLMNDNGLSEVEIEREGMKIKLRKAQAEVPGGIQPVTYTLPSVPVMPSAPKAAEPAAAPAAPAAQAESKSNLKDIKSPMVGTFYRAPSPEAAPFVEIGQTVEVGQVVCIVEAMKLMNEIKSEVRGKIVETCVDNAEPVEFGQALFRVDPSK
ncbi:MAG: acetyl-CoA carboxylase biotin carboxyl carrier protein [Candidatus Omnitrophica bacterium]|nr:acetyl-CoA carboxylase biotin carboxyl carrier protein [Candidatus Omnitrophota bacterium]